MEKIFIFCEGTKLDILPNNPVDCIAWKPCLKKINITEAEEKCRKSKLMAVVYNIKTNDFHCYKKIPYQGILDEVKQSIVDGLKNNLFE